MFILSLIKLDNRVKMFINLVKARLRSS
uniref:Uncharacterized protein n=1 Tax=Rhizophora mucronata TaxID=61149 RepID=A0A2P2QB99_RHIMU